MSNTVMNVELPASTGFSIERAGIRSPLGKNDIVQPGDLITNDSNTVNTLGSINSKTAEKGLLARLTPGTTVRVLENPKPGIDEPNLVFEHVTGNPLFSVVSAAELSSAAALITDEANAELAGLFPVAAVGFSGAAAAAAGAASLGLAAFLNADSDAGAGTGDAGSESGDTTPPPPPPPSPSPPPPPPGPPAPEPAPEPPPPPAPMPDEGSTDTSNFIAALGDATATTIDVMADTTTDGGAATASDGLDLLISSGSAISSAVAQDATTILNSGGLSP